MGTLTSKEDDQTHLCRNVSKETCGLQSSSRCTAVYRDTNLMERRPNSSLSKREQRDLWAAVVFKMHYDELMEKQDEIQKLSAVIQVLSQQ